MATDKPPSKLAAAGYIALGSAFLIEGVKIVREIVKGGNGGSKVERLPVLTPPPQLGYSNYNRSDESSDQAGLRTRGAIEQVTLKEVGSIEERFGEIRKMLLKGSLDPRVRERAMAIITRKCGIDGNRSWCVPEKDQWAEVCAIFNAHRDPNSPTAVRYVRDHPDVDQFTAAGKTMFRMHGEDCDGQTISLGAQLRSVGYPLRGRIIRAKGAKSWSHIYLLVGLPATEPDRWVPLDTTVPGAEPGWEAPSSLVEATRDFEV